MPPKNKYTDPKLRDEVKEEIQQSDKGGAPGQWSARKAQMMAKEYKARGGDYNTPKSDKDESQKHLDKWGEEDWQTKECSGDAKQKDGTQKRYLPKKAWEQMSEKEKKETDEKKLKESKEGKQFVGNTDKAKKARKKAAEDDEQSEGEEEGGEEKEEDDKDKKGTGKNQEKSTKAATKKEDGKAKTTNGNASKKRTRSQDDDQDKEEKSKKTETPQKKQKDDSGSAKKDTGKTIGSKHDKAEAPAKQGSVSRLPKKGQKAHWKAMPGWVDGEVVEVLKSGKKVDGKDVKASKDDPKVILKSRSSGKICVHKADNVYFD